jgi:hypothetical protein
MRFFYDFYVFEDEWILRWDGLVFCLMEGCWFSNDFLMGLARGDQDKGFQGIFIIYLFKKNLGQSDTKITHSIIKRKKFSVLKKP